MPFLLLLFLCLSLCVYVSLVLATLKRFFPVFECLHPTLSLAGLDATKQLQQREAEKRRQNLVACRQMNWNPVPFAVTTMGQWGPKAKRFIVKIIKLRALQTKETFADVAHEVWGTVTEAVGPRLPCISAHRSDTPG